MERPSTRSWLVVAALAWAAFSAPGTPARADTPVLGVYTEGAYVAYPLADITGIRFASEALVVQTSAAVDSFDLATVERLEFTSVSTSVGDAGSPSSLPAILNLFPNRPNPFSPETRIAFRLERPGRALVRIYGVDGRLVRTLLDEELPAGFHDVFWNGHDEARRRVAPGAYFYKLDAPGIEESRRMVMVR
jgi:hypothetical protein